MAAKKNALGRGLGALIEKTEETPEVKGIYEVPIEKVSANPFQPRDHFDEEALIELSTSIKELGVIVPITVRVIDGSFQLIAGERRFKASKMAGLETIPAYVRVADDQNMLEMALVENIQREQLDPIEVAVSYKRLIDECSLTHDNLSERVGKKRTTITNYIRLLKLPGEVQLGLREKKISMGHARALITIEDPDTQLMIYRQILKYGFSVRKVEEVVRELLTGDKTEHTPEKQIDSPTEYSQLIAQLKDFFKTDIEFKRSDTGKGKIVIPFKSDEELEKIIGIIDGLN